MAKFQPPKGVVEMATGIFGGTAGMIGAFDHGFYAYDRNKVCSNGKLGGWHGPFQSWEKAELQAKDS